MKEVKCSEQAIFLPAVEADYTPISSSDMPQSLPLNGIHTPAAFSDPEPQMAGSPACGCTREMFGCSTHPNTPAEWIVSMRASLARILAQQVKGLELPESEADCIKRSSGQLELFALNGSCSKTPPSSEPAAGMSSSPTFGRSDIPGATESCPRLMSAPRISGIGGGALQGVPTPKASDGAKGGPNQRGSKGDLALPAWAARMWPSPTCFDSSSDTNPEFWAARRERAIAKHGTKGAMGQPLRIAAQFPSPAARDYRSGKGRQPDNGHTPQLPEVIGGTLNPTWVAWLMGWPLEATRLNALETGRFLSARRRPGKSLAGLESAPFFTHPTPSISPTSTGASDFNNKPTVIGQ